MNVNFFERILVILESIERVKQKRHLTNVADTNVRLKGWENLGLLRGGGLSEVLREILVIFKNIWPVLGSK